MLESRMSHYCQCASIWRNSSGCAHCCFRANFTALYGSSTSSGQENIEKFSLK